MTAAQGGERPPYQRRQWSSTPSLAWTRRLTASPPPSVPRSASAAGPVMVAPVGRSFRLGPAEPMRPRGLREQCHNAADGSDQGSRQSSAFVADDDALGPEVQRPVLGGDRRGDHVAGLEVGGVAFLAGEEHPPLERRRQQVPHLLDDRRRRLQGGTAGRAGEEQVTRVQRLEPGQGAQGRRRPGDHVAHRRVLAQLPVHPQPQPQPRPAGRSRPRPAGPAGDRSG